MASWPPILGWLAAENKVRAQLDCATALAHTSRELEVRAPKPAA
jgi:hypothetical protein